MLWKREDHDLVGQVLFTDYAIRTVFAEHWKHVPIYRRPAIILDVLSILDQLGEHIGYMSAAAELRRRIGDASHLQRYAESRYKAIKADVAERGKMSTADVAHAEVRS